MLEKVRAGRERRALCYESQGGPETRKSFSFSLSSTPLIEALAKTGEGVCHGQGWKPRRPVLFCEASMMWRRLFREDKRQPASVRVSSLAVPTLNFSPCPERLRSKRSYLVSVGSSRREVCEVHSQSLWLAQDSSRCCWPACYVSRLTVQGLVASPGATKPWQSPCPSLLAFWEL